PEIFKLPAPADELAIGNLDEDFYRDVAVASGNQLTIIGGRGQAYPWDLIPNSGITRPAATVATRRMPFSIAAMAVGRFGAKRGESLALLGADGNLYRLEANRRERPSNIPLSDRQTADNSAKIYLPSDAEPRALAILTESSSTGQIFENRDSSLIDPLEIAGGKFGEFMLKKQREAAEKYNKLSKEEREKMLADGMLKKAEYSERARTAFLRSISGKPSTLAGWSVETLAAGAPFAAAAGSNAASKMLKVNVSSSSLDDILIADAVSNRIGLVSQIKTDPQSLRAEITNLDVDGGLQAVLPLRLNRDALSDLVVLRKGAAAPSTVMTAPAQVIIVTTADENGDCQGDNPCRLRTAIDIANQTPGVDEIDFAIGSATIAPIAQLPVITEGVTIFGGVNGSGQPLVEISGNQAGESVDGLKIRANNVSIHGLAVNQFKSLVDVNTNSQTGGNGITIESTTGSPNHGNDIVQSCYLGTDRTGSLDKGNDAAGLNIYDADSNTIGGPAPGEGNLISGNGSPEVRGVGISVTAGNDNIFQGNVIGLNSLGTGRLGNSQGVFLTGANNSFGGDGAGEGNTVSGNNEVYDIPNNQCDGLGVGIPRIIDLFTNVQLTLNNNLKGNRIGTNPAGTVGLGNCFAGISTNPYVQTIIGSITPGGRNVVSDNGRGGISCSVYSDLQQVPSEGGFCQIAGNNIGTDITGNIGIGNDGRNVPGGFFSLSGVVAIGNSITYSTVGGPGGTMPNGACTGFCNLISDSQDVGFGYGSGLVTSGYGDIGIYNNFIGTNQSGTAAIPNDFAGIVATHWFGTTFIGGDLPGLPAGNLVAGNRGVNILVGTSPAFAGFAGSYSVLGNRVGTDVSGNFSLQPAPAASGGSTGIVANASIVEVVRIGSSAVEGRNIVSGHKGDGTYGAGSGIVASGAGGSIKIVNNLIGLGSTLQPLGNQADGIAADGFGVQIGGTDEEANQIAFNGTNGRNFAGVLVRNTAHGITIRNNSFRDNIGLGIDLNLNGTFDEGDGVTDNDCYDTDFGGNELQNYPVLLSETTDEAGHTVFNGYLRSKPSEDYTIDFYGNLQADPNDGNHHEGRFHYGSITLTTNANGFRSFSYTVPSGVPTYILTTATATDSFGNTSEFSCGVGECLEQALTIRDAEARYAAGGCLEPIVVNVTTDDDDDDLTDDICDTDTGDNQITCSLRAAIEQAEHTAGADVITFNIPGETLHGISPATPLPELNQPISIDATTQPGYNGAPVIILDGINTTESYGLRIKGGSSLVRGLSIVNFKEQLGISGSSGRGQNRVGGNFIGVFPNGAVGNASRQQFGIALVGGATENQIGGVQPQNRNVIGGNGEGISISTGSKFNRLNNNFVGVFADGVTPVPNQNGIVLRGSTQNNIGGFLDTGPNVVSFNQETGIVLDNSSSNRISGNLIGTTSDGSSPAGNQTGIELKSGSADNIVGGTTFNEKNVISAHNSNNNSVGVVIRPDAGLDNTIAGNYLGVSAAGDVGLPNRIGIAVNADHQKIGNPNEGDYRNLIVCANTADSYGVYLHPFFPNDELTDVVVQNNTIGTLTFGAGSAGQIGIYLTGNVKNAEITGNTVGNQSFAGIRLFDGPHNNNITGNRVGVKTTNEAIPNYHGIAIRQADTNFIRDNIVSGNTSHGIIVGDAFGQNDLLAPGAEKRPAGTTGSFAINNVITGNKVGTDGDSTFIIANGGVGIGVGVNARDITIGGPGNLKNIVGGAAGVDYPFGIFVGTINDIADENTLPHGIRIEGNRIGVGSDPNNSYLGNRFGIYVRNAVDTVIGGDTATKGNIVGNSFDDGIRIFKPLTSNTTITNNYIGVLPNGDPIPNGRDGISVDDTGSVEITLNTICGNTESGIAINNVQTAQFQKNAPNGDPAPSAQVNGNTVGVFHKPDGTWVKVPNQTGVKVSNSSNTLIGARPNSGASPNNIISGNNGFGISIEGANSSHNKINNSIVGSNEEGLGGLGNGVGIDVTEAFLTEIGTISNQFEHRLQVLRNQEEGARIENAALLNSVNNATFNFNGSDGILIKTQANKNSIGVSQQLRGFPNPKNAAAEQFGNIIANNGGAGVRIDETAGNENIIDPTLFYGNAGLGIDLGVIGHTPNDPDDADEGANRGQNYPEIVSKSVINNELVVSFKVDSAPGYSNYGDQGLYVEFFKADPSGEGEKFLGSTRYTIADYNSLTAGAKTVNLGDINALEIGLNDPITATATDFDGNTSEFFPPFTPTAAGVAVGGRIVDQAGRGLAGVTVTLTAGDGRTKSVRTNNFGRFRFDDVTVGETCVIAAANRKYRFEPASQVVTVDDARDDLVFTAAP
ncbi:MAG: carboxypeptidase regulatory-like domain-containing protein, partial [Acidobacteria bacterium]|nr:carboxypeptidase regulatory-like domain-containing protein [Acidobacteriota bacterium]